MQKFAHLHCHSEYSLLKGVGGVDAWYERASEIGITALAFTERANMGSSMSAYLESLKHPNVKCIFGLQILLVNDVESDTVEEPISLLAMNDVGYKNLLNINKYSWEDGFSTKRNRPRITLEEISKYSEGIIALTGSMTGPVFVSYTAGYNIARLAFQGLYDVFGDNLRAEIILSELARQSSYNQALLKIAKEFGVKPVITNDCNYVMKGHDKLQKCLIKLRNEKFQNAYEDDDSTQKWLKSYKQLDIIRRNLHGYITESKFEEYVGNTNDVADACNVELEIGHHSLPSYDIQSHLAYEGWMTTNYELFINIAEDGFQEKIVNNKERSKKLDEYKKQFEFEIDVLTKANFIDYFLIVEDIIRWSKSAGIEVGAARGSVAGSLVAFCMGITDIDPLQFDLMFERFLNPTRVSGERAKSADALPDIDLDFEQARRNDVKKYVQEKYGHDRFCTIGTYQTLKAKGLLRDLYRVFDKELPVTETTTKECDEKEINALSSSFEKDKIETVEDAAKKSEEFKKFRKKYPYFVDFYYTNLSGQIKCEARHAAGVIVTPSKITNWVPVRTQKGDDGERVLVSQWEDTYCERRGLLKLDILGIKTLDVCKYARQQIDKRHDIVIDITKIDLDKKPVLRLFAKGETEGVFQFNSNLQSNYLQQLGELHFEDLITTNAILRPGPMDAKAHEDFIKLKSKAKKPKYDHEILKGYLSKTYGLYVYQEDVMRTAHVLGNLTLAQADIMRSAIKKKDASMIDSFKNQFIKGCMAHGLKQKHGEEVWNKLLAFSTYGFNRSHSASYAVFAYFCQWIKYNFGLEFWTSVLEFASQSDKDNENIWTFRNTILKYGYKFEKPRATRHDSRFYISKRDRIVWPIKAIKGIGEKASLLIAEACKEHKPKTLKEFYDAVPKRVVNKKIFKLLISAGALDHFGKRRDVVKEYYIDLRGDKEIPEPFDFDLKKDKDKWEDLENDALGYAKRSVKERYAGWFSSKMSTVKDLNNASEGKYLIMGGVVKRAFPYNSKGGKIMFVNVEDTDGEFLVFLTTAYIKGVPANSLPKAGDIVEVFGVKAISYRGEVELLLKTAKNCRLKVM